jgi:hypothetical protein
VLPDATDLPYVIKSPWTYQFIGDVLARPTLQFDAIVLPMRDLTEAAASRCIVELQAMHNILPWASELTHTWEHFAHSPGGIVFSTSPVDQARLLAVGFHHLVNHAVKAEIPIVMLSFPRLVEDADYLCRKLAPVLPCNLSPELSRAALAETADPRKVRVGAEISAAGDFPDGGFRLEGPSRAHLDRAALARLLARVRRDLADSQGRLHDATIAERDLRHERDLYATELQAIRQALASMTAERDAAVANADAWQSVSTTMLETLRQKQSSHSADTEEMAVTARQGITGQDQVRQNPQIASGHIDQLHYGIASSESATTWRIALFLRRVAIRLPWAVPLLRRCLPRISRQP